MTSTRRAVSIALVSCLFSLFAALPAHAAPTGTFSSTPMYFSVGVGPDRATPCTVVGELFVPDGLSPTDRTPAILTTHGFGGSYPDQVPFAQFLAREGYVALAYSGLGFGGSTCRVSLDDPDVDGAAASRLVDFLGGAPGVAFFDRALTQPVPALDVVRTDSVDNGGVTRSHDPRVGMVGGSYGGGNQFAAASVDKRIDTIVPMITWNDLSYSLAPNTTSAYSGVSTSVPGSAKTLSALGLLVSGSTRPGLPGFLTDPGRLQGCPNFVDYVCGAIEQAVTSGQLDSATIDRLRKVSVASYVDRITIPVLLAQGQHDTLFDLNEATATYEALTANGVDVKMMWQSWGHTDMEPAPGEYSQTEPDPQTQYETGRILDWLDHHLKDESVDTGPTFAYFRDWIPYTGNAEPAYATSATFPVGTHHTVQLSADGRLVDGAATSYARTLVTGPAGLPLGTELSWATAPFGTTFDVVGAPTLSLSVTTPGEAVIFAKLYDVAPDGTSTLIDGFVSPMRFTNPAAPLEVTLPAIVHRFDAGHSLRLALTGGDANFRGALQSVPVTVTEGQLTLPRA